MISFIVPAHNEQAMIGKTLEAIHNSARVVGQPYEIIVVDDASTDGTAEIARQNNALVVSVNHRQIAATRNSGARAAQGERLFFVDADTIINPRVVESALGYMDKGAVGGGAPILFEGSVPFYIQLAAFFGVFYTKLVGFTGGAFMYCTREAFVATGGFDERFYYAEDGAFALALKREGRFVVLWKPVLSSGRRFRTNSVLLLPPFIVRMIFSPIKTLTQRASVEKIWYNSNRQDDEKVSNSWGVQVFNGIALLITMVLLSGPLWYFIPQSLTPLASPLGKIRLVIGIFLCHAGLVFWLFAMVLIMHLFRKRYWIEWIKLAALTAFCLWIAWDSTQGVVWFWRWVLQIV